MLSVIIPSRRERFLPNTIEDILAKAEGEIEVIAVLEGYLPDPPLKEDPKVRIIHHVKPMGMRVCINDGVAIAKGRYLMKCDAHCMFDYGFDYKLATSCDKTWVVIPRRYSLDAENWTRRRPTSPTDYEHFTYPYYKTPHIGLYTLVWNQRRYERQNNPRYLVDDMMAFQGSCWFTYANHFRNVIGKLQEKMFGLWAGEPQEVGLKTWLSGGRVVVNKKTWYAHLHKGKRFKSYSRNKRDIAIGHARTVDYWMNNQWPDRKRDFEWLVDKFWPIPTWPEDWREQLKERPIPSWEEILKIHAGS